MTTASRPRLLTAEEFMHLPEDPEGRRMELFDGEVISMPPPGEERSDISGAIYLALTTFVREHKLGKVNFEMGFKIRRQPDRVVAPDVSWLTKDAAATERDSRGYFPGPPTLAVEVISPSDIERDSEHKVHEYLAAGARRVWVVRPVLRSVTVHRPNGDSHRFAEGDTLTSDDAGFPVEGFTLSLANLFPAPAVAD